ncbi:MAG: hypothetical protein DI536_28245 [Archangium gephyra]|uniref:Uncharacterized protein n=1 Tax=Archangium gephyra TaxID=48 RepID=A0A2W5SWG2_9BACT|nr:MAG: hypothetical protein DI536_28245 [Archangium gephyra]
MAGSTCVTTPTTSQCGANGNACTTCTAVDSCISGACTIDPTSTWLVRPSQVRVNNSWDATSAPDIFVEIWCPSTATSISYTTTTIGDATTATWAAGGCTMTADQLLNLGFDFRVWDEDLSDHDLVQARTSATPMDSHLRAGMLTGNTATLLNITFTFIKQ